MPDAPPKQSIVSRLERWGKNPAVAMVVFVIIVIISDLITTAVHPFDVQLLNVTGQSIPSSHALAWLVGNTPFIAFLIASIVAGVLAQRQVNRAQDKTKEAEANLATEKTNLKAETERADKAESKATKLEAELNKVNEELARLRQKAEASDRTSIEEEFESIIKPSYLALKNDSFVLSLIADPTNQSYKSSDWDKVKSILDLWRDNKHLVPPRLQTLMGDFLKFKQKQIEKIPMSDQNYTESAFRIYDIKKLVEERYIELSGEDQADEKEQLEKLIAPLFLEFDKYPDVDQFKRTYKGLPLVYSLMEDPNNKDYKRLGADKAENAIRIMKEYGRLAQPPQLKELIKQLLDFKQAQSKGAYTVDEYRNMETVAIKIEELVRARHNELAWGKKGS